MTSDVQLHSRQAKPDLLRLGCTAIVTYPRPSASLAVLPQAATVHGCRRRQRCDLCTAIHLNLIVVRRFRTLLPTKSSTRIEFDLTGDISKMRRYGDGGDEGMHGRGISSSPSSPYLLLRTPGLIATRMH